jgi:hypothetical protein
MFFCPCGASRPFPIRSLPYITNLHFSLSALPQSITINLSKHTQSNNTRLTSPAPVPRTDPPILPSSAPLPPRITAAPSAYPLGSCLLPLAFSACFVACAVCYRPSARARAGSEALGSGNGNGLGCVGGLPGWAFSVLVVWGYIAVIGLYIGCMLMGNTVSFWTCSADEAGLAWRICLLGVWVYARLTCWCGSHTLDLPTDISSLSSTQFILFPLLTVFPLRSSRFRYLNLTGKPTDPPYCSCLPYGVYR